MDTIEEKEEVDVKQAYHQLSREVLVMRSIVLSVVASMDPYRGRLVAGWRKQLVDAVGGE